MKSINCDINHIEDGMKRMNNNNNNIDYLNVWDTHCVMRGITIDEMKERNILADDPEQVCQIEYSACKNFRLHFHQSQVEYENNFSFSPYNSSNCTYPEELGDKLAEVVRELDSMYDDTVWNFAGVEAASFGRDGKLTDFEFEYDLMVY